MRYKLSLLVASLLTIPLISAASLGFGRYGSPFDYFNNEWIKFTIVLVVVSLLIYYFVNKKTDNTPVSLIVGFGLGLLLTISLMRRGILDSFLEETIVDWILIIAILFVIFFLFYKLAFKEDMYGYRRFSLWRFIFALVLIALIPLFVDLEKILPEALMYGPFLDFIEILEAYSNFIFIGLGILIIYFVFRTIFRGGRRVGRGAWRGARGVGRAGRWAGRKGWRGARGVGRGVGRITGRNKKWRKTYKEAKRINKQSEQRANQADWARKEDIRKKAVAEKWKSRAMIIQKRDAEKQAARQAREQAQKQAEQERSQGIRQKLIKEEKRKSEMTAYKENERRNLVAKKQRAQNIARIRKERFKKLRKGKIEQGRKLDKAARKEYTERQKPKNKWPRQEEWRNQNIKKYTRRMQKQAKAKAVQEAHEKQRNEQQQEAQRQKERLEAAKRKREEHREKRERRLPMHQGNVNKRLFKKYGARKGKYKNTKEYPR